MPLEAGLDLGEIPTRGRVRRREQRLTWTVTARSVPIGSSALPPVTDAPQDGVAPAPLESEAGGDERRDQRADDRRDEQRAPGAVGYDVHPRSQPIEQAGRAPRARSARILDRRRFLNLFGAAAVMAVGTLAVSRYATATGPGSADEIAARSAIMALTTFVLFQVDEPALGPVPRPERVRPPLAHEREAVGGARPGGRVPGVAVEVPAVQQLMTGADVSVGLRPTDWLLMAAVATTVLIRSELLVRWRRHRAAA